MAKNMEGPICLCVVLIGLVFVLVLASRGPAHPQRYERMPASYADPSDYSYAGSPAPHQPMLMPIGERNATCELRPNGACWLISGEAGTCSRDGLYCMVSQFA